VIDAAEEAFEDDVNQALSFCLRKQGDQLPDCNSGLQNLLASYQQTKVMAKLQSIPSYQATLLLTEYNLMLRDTGPLPMHLRHHLASQAFKESGKFKEFSDETRKMKNFEKCVALQRVDKIMAEKPWAVNKYHIEELRLVNLSLSEIVHALLIMAHTHSILGIEKTLHIAEKDVTRRRKPGQIRTCVDRTENLNNADGEEHWEESPLVVDRLQGLSCERYWDECGFSVLNFLHEDASCVIDNRFSSAQNLINGNKNTSKFLQAVWRYSQVLLGFSLDDYENELIDKVLDKSQKEIIYNICIKQFNNKETFPLKKVSLETVVTVQEARLQAEIVYALHAVTQFMNY